MPGYELENSVHMCFANVDRTNTAPWTVFISLPLSLDPLKQLGCYSESMCLLGFALSHTTPV